MRFGLCPCVASLLCMCLSALAEDADACRPVRTFLHPPAEVKPGAVSGAAEPLPRYVSPKPSAPEHGHGLAREEARDGWISLFDGHTTFGWSGAAVRDGVLTGGCTTTSFGACELRAEIIAGGEITRGADRQAVGPGSFSTRSDHLHAAPVCLSAGVSVRRIAVRPLGTGEVGLTSRRCKVIPHPALPRDRQATWAIAPRQSSLRALGGPGAIELPGLHGDFVLQLTVNCRRPLSNAGVFFRSRPGDFLNGYEAQVFNGCVDGDPARPARYSTGAIDDLQNARRLVSRDGEPFTLTIVATGPHIASWVNGAQMTDWTDERPKHHNPRVGLRLEPGAIQLQAHDRDTDVEFSNVRIAPLDLAH